MKTLYLIFALCGIWISVDGALLECIIKIGEEEPSLVDDIKDLFNITYHITKQMDHNIDLQNFWESFNREIRNICYTDQLMEKLYPLAMRVLKVCVNREHIFTERGKQMAESILKYSFCEVFMKLVTVHSSIHRDTCFINHRITNRDVERCFEGSLNAIKMFSSQKTEMCTAQLETSICINKLMRGKCSDSTLNLMEFLLDGVRNIFGCTSDANTTVVSNSSGINSVLRISKLDSKLRDRTSTSDLKDKCQSKIENDEDIVRDISNLKHTLRNGLENITENLSQRNYKQSLDSMVNDACLPAISDDNLYSLMTRVFNICISQEDVFTEEGKQMLKSLVKRLFCTVPMKLALFGTFMPPDDCYPSLLNLIIEIPMSQPKGPTPRYKFAENNSICGKIASDVDIIREKMKRRCSHSDSEKNEFFVVEMVNFMSDCNLSIESLEIMRASKNVTSSASRSQ